ncbi:MAG: cobalt-precorrin-5B (C(1))-methyltransferase [Pseudomonadota bacterium]
MRKPSGPLRSGWTTGACATAATKAAYGRLLTGAWEDPARITLPKGETPAFALERTASGADWAEATVIKDAGDDPDVTHGAAITARVTRAPVGAGVRFHAGDGVGTITKPGLPIPPGEPAINPVPRQMMAGVVRDLAHAHGAPGDVEITISIADGAALAAKTWNPRLGVAGGLSILGTTGIVRPFSCAAWIASIHRGIDVARAAGETHVCGSTGATSEATAQAALSLPDHAMLDMGDFVGGMIKYLTRNPAPRLTIAGGFGKLTKLAQGASDLHSGRSQVDFARLAACAAVSGADRDAVATSNTALEALQRVGPALAVEIARGAQAQALRLLAGAPVAVDVMIVDRAGAIIAHEGLEGP